MAACLAPHQKQGKQEDVYPTPGQKGHKQGKKIKKDSRDQRNAMTYRGRDMRRQEQQ